MAVHQTIPEALEHPRAERAVDRCRAVQLAAQRRISPALCRAIVEGNRTLPSSAARDDNIAALCAGSAAAVISGQQVGLFLGPAFTLYKAASTVAAAQALEQETGVRTVPVFWLQTEDHDYEEIRRAYIYDRELNTVCLELPADAREPQNRQAVHYRVLPQQIEALHAVVAAQLGHLPRAAEILDVLRAAYYPGAPLAGAFAHMLAALSAESGLIFFNPRWPEAAEEASGIYEWALTAHEEISTALLRQGRTLAQTGLEEQVRVVQGSPLVFFHSTSADGSRSRLHGENGRWKVGATGEIIADQELRRLLALDPGRFSSSALLRPIVQDRLLPSAGYVGGEAEQRYFLQILPLFDALGLPRPLVIARAHFTLLDDKAKRWLSELGIEAGDLSRPRSELLRKLAVHKSAKFPTPDELEQLVQANMETALEPLAAALAQLDQTLVHSLAKSKEKMHHLLHTVVERYTKALGLSDGVTSQRLAKLEKLLVPGGQPQERRYSALNALCRSGQGLFGRLVSEIEPFAGSWTELII